MFSAFVLALLVPKPPLGQIKLDAKRYRDAVIMLAPDNVSHTQNPSSGQAQTHRWKGSGDYEMNLIAADPDAPADVEFEDEEPIPGKAPGLAFVEKETKRLHASLRSSGGQTKTIQNGGFTLTLTYRRDFAGNVSAVESSDYPVVYVRTMQATEKNAERALTDFTSMSYWAGGDRVNLYPGGMPKNWKATFGTLELDAPWPQSSESLPGDPAKGEGAEYRVYDFDGYAIYERTDGKWEPYESVVKRPHPRLADLDTNPDRVKVEKVDVVVHGDKYILRQRGTSGEGQFKEEWMAWIVYGPGMHEWTMLTRRPTGKPWPSGLPFSPEEAGSTSTAEKWGEPDSERRRTVGDLSLITQQGPQTNGEVTNFARDGQDYVIAVYRGAEAKRVRDLFLPPQNGKGLPPVAAKHPNPVVDAGSSWRGEGFFSFVRLWTGNSAIFDMAVYTVQNGEPYTVHLVYMATPKGLAAMTKTLGSIQGKDGQPLWPEALGTYNWYVPGADFRLKVSGMAMYTQQAYKDILYTEGFAIDGGGTKVGVLLFSPKIGGKIPHEEWHKLHAKAVFGDDKTGKTSDSSTNARGAAATARESERDGTILTTIYQSAPNDRAVVVVRRPKSEPDAGWRKLFEVQPKP